MSARLYVGANSECRAHAPCLQEMLMQAELNYLSDISNGWLVAHHATLVCAIFETVVAASMIIAAFMIPAGSQSINVCQRKQTSIHCHDS